MSAAHAVTTKNANNETTASHNYKNTQPVPEIMPETQTGYPEEQFIIQRKENACLCGGGCPKCLGNLGIQAKLKIRAIFGIPN